MKQRSLIHVALSLLVFATLAMAQTSVQEPTLRVVSPNGGEAWANGSTQLIQWRYAGTEKPRTFTIELSQDLGKTYSPVVTNLPPDAQQYEWSVRGGDMKSNLIKVTAELPVANPLLPAFRSVSDVSDAPFTIMTKADNQPPIITPSSLKVGSPNGGEAWADGSTQVISWKYDGTAPTGFTLMLSPDLGKTYQALATSVPGTTREYKWLVKGADSKSNLIKVTVQFADVASPKAEDVSDAPFTIMTNTPPPPAPVIKKLAIMSPKAGDTWVNSSAVEVAWKRMEGMDAPKFYNVMLATDVSSGFTTVIAKEVPGAANSVKWSVKASASTTARVQVIAYFPDGSIESVSDTFTIRGGATTTPAK